MTLFLQFDTGSWGEFILISIVSFSARTHDYRVLDISLSHNLRLMSFPNLKCKINKSPLFQQKPPHIKIYKIEMKPKRRREERNSWTQNSYGATTQEEWLYFFEGICFCWILLSFGTILIFFRARARWQAAVRGWNAHEILLAHVTLTHTQQFLIQLRIK